MRSEGGCVYACTLAGGGDAATQAFVDGFYAMMNCGGGGDPCSMCKQLLPIAHFASKQLRRHDHLRKCRSCIEKFKLTPEQAEQAAARRAQAAAAAHKAMAPKPMPATEPAEVAPLSVADSVEDPLRLARKAETVLRGRTDRICLVLENCSDDLNHVAILRTCEALGVMHVWLVEAAPVERLADDSELSRLANSRAQRRHAARATRARPSSSVACVCVR